MPPLEITPENIPINLATIFLVLKLQINFGEKVLHDLQLDIFSK